MRQCLLVFVCLFASLARAADYYHLARVVVTGSQRYSQDDLLLATGLKIDSQVTPEDLQNAANRLGGSGAFSSVQYLFKAVTGVRAVEADFQVVDADKFLPAAFENFVWFSEGELLAAVHQAVPLFNGQLPTSGVMSDEVSAALTRLLAARGLPSNVTYVLAADVGQLPTVYKFKILNANLAIKDVSVSGATHMQPDLLARTLAPLRNAAYLRSDVVKILEKNLVPLYRAHGFLRFAIADIKPRLGDKDQVQVEVSISEGDQYRLGGFSWSGNTLVTSDELSKRLTLKPGDPVNALQLDRDLVQARKLFGKFGREGVVIKAIPTFAAGTVSYSLEVKEGDLYYMGKVEIEGIDAEQAGKLVQSWKLGEGQPYDNTYINQFLAHAVLKIPGRKWEWMTFEQVDDAQKTVNVRLQVKIE